MTHTEELSEETYEKLQRVAEQTGLTPAEWLEAALSFKSVADAIAPYIVDSRGHAPDPGYRSAFGDLVDEKMAKQGFSRLLARAAR